MTDTMTPVRAEALARGAREEEARRLVIEDMVAQDVVTLDSGVLTVPYRVIDSTAHTYMVEIKVFEVDE